MSDQTFGKAARDYWDDLERADQMRRDERDAAMARWIIVDWENRVVLPESYPDPQMAWHATVALARKLDRSAYEYDQIEIKIEE